MCTRNAEMINIYMSLLLQARSTRPNYMNMYKKRGIKTILQESEETDRKGGRGVRGRDSGELWVGRDR